MAQINSSPLKLKKYTFIGLGWLSFSAGFAGIFLPLLPTVVFWIIAVWLWSRGAPELMEKVYQHPQHGATIKAFMLHGVVPRAGKTAAVVSMTFSYALFKVFVKPDVLASVGVAVLLIIVALWLISRPETPIQDD